MQLRLVYFAWVRERIGLSAETVDIPASCRTIGDLMEWQRARGPEYQNAFAQPGIIRAAIDKRHVKADAPLDGATEIAFFPPVTGG